MELYLAIERPIKIGDIVKVDDVEGEVKDIGLRASQIRLGMVQMYWFLMIL